jgi:hypothetical protein
VHLCIGEQQRGSYESVIYYGEGCGTKHNAHLHEYFVLSLHYHVDLTVL